MTDRCIGTGNIRMVSENTDLLTYLDRNQTYLQVQKPVVSDSVFFVPEHILEIENPKFSRMSKTWNTPWIQGVLAGL